jgi:hypothetical protein
MTHAFRQTLAAAIVLASATAAWAGASSTPTNYQPDPALKTASRGELENRVRTACTVIQARLQDQSEQSLSQPCRCYASRTMRSLSADEIQAYRDTGVFNPTARAKALNAVDACGLQRPL